MTYMTACCYYFQLAHAAS